ncbi:MULTISPECIES: cation diffusion facilitator family transporter [Halomicrobium]|uniref:Cation diffusion facilitator family transporter n=2 Tax=Halomicrobium mukohataei TaxID=57705 RepID=C7P0H3_HALMD|nr:MULTISPECIES: cation diffusion facilitator family transporter [Halomicrobium]ACV46955.1 cation diffusion facilitator family transporter [Halomicrobium mukohataei DSM 12286]QCD65451.1 cation diffusion facilitator family transporter [Halomicrobium mukohataei]QFR20257.1 cation diffusion facilitator family transporter [Halomicrobium sp. ZPS1]
MAGSKSVVLAALVANGAIAILKFVGFLLTGSAAMLSETYHSISDTGNQVFLLIGIRFSDRSADQQHPFGYGKSQFFYSFLVSVFLFGIAGWESAKHGYSQLTGGGHGGGQHAGETVDFLFLSYAPPGWLDPVWVNYTVLIGAFVFEAWALYKARAEMKRQMGDHDWTSYREAFRKTSDVTTLTALTEDTIALLGIVIALTGITLEQLTGNAVFDQLSALLIGLMLMGFALALAWENKRLILGESLQPDVEAELRDIVRSHPGVTSIIGFRTVYFGPEEVLVTADVQFEDGLETDEIDERITAIEAQLKATGAGIQKVYIEPES